MDVIVSGSTDRLRMEAGTRIAPAELCLPAKVFLGHALSLKGKVDALFVSRLVCRRLDGDLFFGCPKAMALPDMTRALIPDLPLVEFVLDERECSEEESYRRLARELGASKAQAKAQARAVQLAGLRPEPAPRRGDIFPQRVRIGVVGHDYLLDDSVLSLGLLDKLRSLGAEPLRDKNQKTELLQSATCHQPSELVCSSLRPAFMPNWMFEKELIDCAMCLAANESVKGLVLATSFACGTSAVTNELIRRAVGHARPRMPILAVTFDEHSAEAGLVTRLESFVELLHLRGSSRLRGCRTWS